MMLKSYCKVVWRNLWKQKLYAFINIGGLAAGMATCMLILSYVAHERSYDRFHEHASRIFSTYTRVKFGTDSIQVPYLSYVSAPLVQSSVPSVTGYLRFRKEKNKPVQNRANLSIIYSEKDILFADSNFFTFFSFPLLKGDPEVVLKAPGKVVISESTAKKYFGTTDPVGKVLTYNGKHDLEVAGVARDAPSNSSIRFDMVVSMPTIRSWEEYEPVFRSQQISTGAFATYFLLDDASSAPKVERAINRLITQAGTEGEHLYFTVMPRIHLYGYYGDSRNLKYLKIFSGVALLILLLALVNYMSLATARAMFRAKEVGVRKVLGAARSRIASQFYIESTLFVLAAFTLGFLLFELFRPYFYHILQLQLDRAFAYSPVNLGVLTAVLIVAILGAGAYPSLFLSSFSPVVLYRKFPGKSSGSTIRKVFIVFQFVIAVGLITSGIVINRQLSYFRDVDTGIDRENVLMIPFASSMGSHYPSFKQNVASLAGVQEVAAAKYPMYGGYDAFSVTPKDLDKNFHLPILNMDHNLLSLLDIQWKTPPLDIAAITRNKGFIINEAAAAKLNLPANPVGERIKFGGEYLPVAGVVRNFNFESLHGDIDALALFITPDTTSGWAQYGGCLFARIVPNANLKPLLTEIGKLYHTYDKEKPFEYHFLDDKFDALYKAEDRLANIFSFFIGLTVLIACLGLLGLATFSAEQRTKEIGVRKVLGASVASVVTLLSKDFVKLVLFAIIIASPIAWWFTNQWLEDFAYRIELKWWMFALAGVLAVIIALLTVGFQSAKAALANPVKSLKSE